MNCKWCGLPKSTHNQQSDHDYAASDCGDSWHGQKHGLGAECPSCRLTATFTMTGMMQMMPVELLQIHQLLRALKLVKRGECWCEMAVGNPMVNKHDPQCVNATCVIRKVDKWEKGII